VPCTLIQRSSPLIVWCIHQSTQARVVVREMATKPDPKSIRVRAKPTPEEIAKLREAREFKRKALAEAAQAEQNKLADYPHPLLALADNPHGRLCEREWVSLGVPSGDCHRVIVKTWNVSCSFSYTKAMRQFYCVSFLPRR
jgi:hypothetical protein